MRLQFRPNLPKGTIHIWWYTKLLVVQWTLAFLELIKAYLQLASYKQHFPNKTKGTSWSFAACEFQKYSTLRPAQTLSKLRDYRRVIRAALYKLILLKNTDSRPPEFVSGYKLTVTVSREALGSSYQNGGHEVHNCETMLSVSINLFYFFRLHGTELLLTAFALFVHKNEVECCVSFLRAQLV